MSQSPHRGFFDDMPFMVHFVDEIKTLFASVKNFTLVFAIMHLMTLSEELFPAIDADEDQRAVLFSVIYGLSFGLYLLNFVWLVGNTRLRSAGRFRHFPWISMLLIFGGLSYIYFLYLGSNIHPLIFEL